jgi:hypothetical protein
MNKEQEGKYRDFINRLPRGACGMVDIWKGCCKANGINTEEPMETNGAPEWVIEIMRTGKSVRCKVWDGHIKYGFGYAYITGYDINEFASFIGYSDNENESGSYDRWIHAVPILAWTPKEGEAVFCFGDKTGITIEKVRMVADNLVWTINLKGEASRSWDYDRVKPFDASNIGKTWSDI